MPVVAKVNWVGENGDTSYRPSVLNVAILRNSETNTRETIPYPPPKVKAPILRKVRNKVHSFLIAAPCLPPLADFFYSEKIFYCISVQILVSSLFSVYPQHTVTDADMRLNVLRTVLLRLQLFAQCRHKHSQGSYIVFPAAAPNLLCDIGVRQHLSDIMREQAQKLVFNRGQVQFLPI